MSPAAHAAGVCREGMEHDVDVRLGDRRRNGFGREDAGQRGVTAGHPLARDEDVRRAGPVLVAEGASGAAEAGHDLVGDQQDVVAIADLADSRPVPFGRDEGAAARTHDRLAHERGNRVRALGLDGRLEGIEVVAGGVVGRTAQRVGRGGRRIALQDVLEPPLARSMSAEGRRAQRRPVIGDRPADDLVLLRPAERREVLYGDLHGGLDALGAAAGQVYA